jgi:C1A family cysteine protease
MFKTGKPIKAAGLPPSIDLRAYCSPVEDQKNLGSCTAQAVVGLVEYFQNRAKGEFLDGSRLFLYRVTRKLYHLHGDTGAYIRGTIRALRVFGVCPEDYWPYNISEFDHEPTAFCYAFGQNYKAVNYYRLWDPDPAKLIEQLKGSLANGLPFAFGFSVYSSIWDPEVQSTGNIPVPQDGEQLEGGHAIMAVGYDDNEARFIIRNSWGTSWGNAGYGTLPYEYVEKGLADDFWVLVTADYVSMMGL